ncbi:MAG: amidohydrolase, partial [Clostridia bacterium]|nr:amidohydrolase [Clostridia bacterium]
MTDRELFARVDAVYDWAVALRRRIHENPELGEHEFGTQRTICAALEEIGVEYAAESTWVVGLIRGAQPGPTVAIRADIDALPVTEPEGCPFRSKNEG